MRKLTIDPNIYGIPADDSSNHSILDRVCTVLLALCPILQHYKGLFSQDASTTLMVLLFVYFGIKLLRKKTWHFATVLPLLVFSGYELINHGIGLMEFAREALLVAYFVAAASGAIDLKYYTKTAINVAFAASVLLIVQYFCYYVLGFHLQLVATSLLEESNSQWFQLVQTGTIGVTGKSMGYYRPSAFFLEPSHLTIYCFPALAMVLLMPGMTRSRTIAAAVLSLGIVMSTSGMGIAIVLGLWVVYIALYLGGERKLKDVIRLVFTRKGMLVIGAGVAALLLLYLVVEPFRLSINRIFVGTGGKSAISGRTSTGIKAVSSMRGIELLVGKSDWGEVSSWNMSGLFYTMYTQGILGVVLSYVFYVRSVLKTKRSYLWMALVILGLSVFTVHTHAAFYMMFYVLILLGGYPADQDSKLVLNNRLQPTVEKIISKCARTGK